MPERAERLAGYLEDAAEVAYFREYRTFTGFLDGVKVSVTSTGMGGPSMAIAAEELRECGAHTMIRVGTCESTCSRVLKGELVLPNGAVRMEGVADHYAPREYPAVPDMDVLAALSYLVQGRADNFRAVFRAWRDFLKWHPSLAKKRRAIQSSRKAGVRHIYRGSILLRYFLGGRTVGRLM